MMSRFRFTVFTGLLVFLFTTLCLVGAQAKTLSVYIPDATIEGQKYLEQVVAPAFSTANKNVKVEYTYVTWTEYLDRLLVSMVGGTPPDVVQVGGEFVGTFVLDGLIQPLDSYLKKWPYLAEYPKSALLDGQVEGKQYTIPYRLDVRTLVYRKDFFEEAGLNAEKPPQTWDDLLKAAKKLVRFDKEGAMTRAGFHTIPAVHESLSFLFQGGARLVDSTGTKATFNSKEGIKAIEFYVDLARQHNVGQISGGPYGQGGNPVVAGTAAMENTGDWAVGQMVAAMPNTHQSLGVALPTTGVEQRAVLNVNKWAITSMAKDADLAWAFIDFMSKPDRLAEWSRINSFMPARGTLYRMQPWVLDKRWQTFYQAAELSIPMPPQAYNLAQVFTYMATGLGESFAGTRSVTDAMNEAARLATAKLQAMK